MCGWRLSPDPCSWPGSCSLPACTPGSAHQSNRGRQRRVAMPPARLVVLLVLGAALLTARPDPAAAQSELQMWLSPELVKQIARSDYRYTFYPPATLPDPHTP